MSQFQTHGLERHEAILDGRCGCGQQLRLKQGRPGHGGAERRSAACEGRSAEPERIDARQARQHRAGGTIAGRLAGDDEQAAHALASAAAPSNALAIASPSCATRKAPMPGTRETSAALWMPALT